MKNTPIHKTKLKVFSNIALLGEVNKNTQVGDK